MTPNYKRSGPTAKSGRSRRSASRGVRAAGVTAATTGRTSRRSGLGAVTTTGETVRRCWRGRRRVERLPVGRWSRRGAWSAVSSSRGDGGWCARSGAGSGGSSGCTRRAMWLGSGRRSSAGGSGGGRRGRLPRRSGRSTSARGYGAAHQALRRRWQAKVATGLVACVGVVWRSGRGSRSTSTTGTTAPATWGPLMFAATAQRRNRGPGAGSGERPKSPLDGPGCLEGRCRFRPTNLAERPPGRAPLMPQTCSVCRRSHAAPAA